MDIMIVEDHEPTRSRLVSLLDGQNGYRVIAAVDSSEKALEFIASSCPDIIIHDLGLPGLSGPEAIKKQRRSVHPWRYLSLRSWTRTSRSLRQ